MYLTTHPLGPHPLASLSMWVLVHTASQSHHLLMLLVQVPLEIQMCLLMVPTPAADSVAAAKWLGSGDVNAGGTRAYTSAVEDGLCPGFKGRDTSASSSSYLLTVHSTDASVDVTHLLSLQNVAPGGSIEDDDCASVDCGVTHARLYDDAQRNDDDNDSTDILDAILGHMSQHEDAGYDDEGVDISVGVGVGAVVGVGVNSQGVSLGVGLGVSLGVASPPLASLDS